MRIAIAGGNGFIGRALTEELTRAGHDVVWLSHRPGRASGRTAEQGPVGEVPFDPRVLEGLWVEEVARADAVANLSGYPISVRWNDRTQALIRESRVPLTAAIVEAIAMARAEGRGPAVLVNASGAGIYGERGNDMLTEDEPAGDDWLAQLAVEWEAEAYRAREFDTRVVTVRTGVVLGEEGALPRLVMPMRLFVGGPLGSGRQWFPWVHKDDIVGLYRHAIENESVDGPMNAVSPETMRMRDFAHALGHRLRRPSWFPVPLFALKLVVGQVAPSLLASQCVTPQAALDSGYAFRFPTLARALEDLFP